MTNDQEQHWRSYTTAINTISTRKLMPLLRQCPDVVTKGAICVLQRVTSNMLTALEATV